MQRALQGVDEASIEGLLESNGLKLIHFALLPEKNPDVPGRLFNNNAIFTITAADAATQHRALVLRVLNCHPWRQRRNGPNEVATLKWLEAQSMPLTSRVIDFSVDGKSSPLHCEFILMEKLPGVQLRHLWPSLTMSERLVYLRQLVEWLHTLYAVPRPGGDRPGLASLRLDDEGEVVADQPVVLVDGPTLPTASKHGFAALATSILEDACSRLPSGSLKEALEGVIRKDLCEYAARYEQEGAPAEELRLCHNDLNLGNILVLPEEGRLSGIVDWEGASWGFTDQDLLDLDELAQSCGAAGQLVLGVLRPAPGHVERQRLMELLREVPGLYFFNATWYGALADQAARKAASLNESRLAEEAILRWLAKAKQQ